MTVRITDVKDLIERQGEAFDAFVTSYGEKLAVLEKENILLRERLEDIESHRNSPGRTTATRKQDEHKRLFADWLRKPTDTSRELKLRNFEAGEFKDVTIGSDPGGGFAVPEEISREISMLELKYSPVRSLVAVRRAGTSDYKEIVDVTGTTSGWVGEAGTRSATATPKLRERKPTQGELYAYPQASEWSLDDIFFDVGAWLAASVAREFARQTGIAVISGNGTDKPTGMLNTSPVATADFASPERNASAYQLVDSDTALSPAVPGIVPDSLITLVYAVNSAYRSNGGFAMNSLTAAAIRKLKDSQNQYLWQPGLIAGQPDRLLGYPVSIWEDMPDIGAGNFPVAFGDFARAYVVVDRTDVRILRDPYSNPGFVRFYVRRRLGGTVLDNYAVKFLRTV